MADLSARCNFMAEPVVPVRLQHGLLTSLVSMVYKTSLVYWDRGKKGVQRPENI